MSSKNKKEIKKKKFETIVSESQAVTSFLRM